jgi:hypothetical protein
MDTRRTTEGSAGVLGSTSKSSPGRSAVDMSGSAAAIESWREMRASPQVSDREYGMPRIKTTPMVRFALYALVIYLSVLFGLLVFRFLQVFR